MQKLIYGDLTVLKQNVLVIAAHPDDEVLGCGGTIAKHVALGATVDVVILAEGITARSEIRSREGSKKELSELTKIAQAANDILGVNSLTLHNFADNRMDSIDRLEVIKFVEKLIDKFKPSVIYTHHSGDVNIDHRIIHEAVITACRPIPDHSVKQLLFFEVASSTEWQPAVSAPYFAPNWFVDISDFLVLKLKALEVYNTEMREYPHSWSIKALEYLARWRGATVGVQAAESFILGRKLS